MGVEARGVMATSNRHLLLPRGKELESSIANWNRSPVFRYCAAVSTMRLRRVGDCSHVACVDYMEMMEMYDGDVC